MLHLALPTLHPYIHLSKCEEISFISASRKGLITGMAPVGGRATIIDLVKDQLLHFSLFMTGIST